MSTETPRTDKVEAEFRKEWKEMEEVGWPSFPGDYFDISRQLERDLARVTEERDAALRRVDEIQREARSTLQAWDALRMAHGDRDENERRAFADSIAALEARLDAAEKGKK